MSRAPGDVTRLLAEYQNGNEEAFDALVAAAYGELRAIAARHLRGERGGHTLQPTALVNEAYVKLVGGAPVDWQGRTHFFAAASGAMRHVLVDHARRRLRAKRGGARQRVTLSEAAGQPAALDAEVVALHEALERLAQVDARQARVVELRFFGGLSVEEAAAAMGLSRRTVEGEWTHAKAWLRRELDRGNGA